VTLSEILRFGPLKAQLGWNAHISCGEPIARRFMARADAGEEAADAGDRRARQQDRAHRLGAARQGRSLSSSGRRGLAAAGVRMSGR
jgi:hypothetical protein